MSSNDNGVGLRWTVRRRQYRQEAMEKASTCKLEEASSHPLQGVVVSSSTSSSTSRGAASVEEGKGGKGGNELKKSNVVFDPLSQFASEMVDPLSRLSISQNQTDSPLATKSRAASINGVDLNDGSFVPWSARRTSILTKYTTSEKLSIVTMLLTTDDRKEVESKVPTATVTDKVRTRLEQLDDFEEGSTKEMLNLSQQEYMERIEELSHTLTEAWRQDQRVRFVKTFTESSLKIAIQCAKLLVDTSVIQFYPSKFVFVTDILDTFGRIVYDRLLSKTAYYSPTGDSNNSHVIDPNQVPESAKETCRNWFFKIASIRELIPRLYVEASILKCYSFLSSGEAAYRNAIDRLIAMTRGIGDPLVSMYARCYVCRVGRLIAPQISGHLMPCFDDFLRIFPKPQSDVVRRVATEQKLSIQQYQSLYTPNLEWILSCIQTTATPDVTMTVLERCKTECNNALLLSSIMTSFKPEFVSANALLFARAIQECQDLGSSEHLLYRTLGTCVVAVYPPLDQRLVLLNEVWKAVMKLAVVSDYMSCAEVWIEYVVRLFGKREVNALLGDIIKHMTPDRAYEEHYPQLETIVGKVVSHQTDILEVFSLAKFMPFIDMFQKDSVKVSVCKNIMEAYSVRQPAHSTSDPIIINALTFLCKTMHDSVNALSLDDEVRAIGSLINSFISSVSYEKDLEKQLAFYVECRATFNNIDPVLMFVVHMVNNVAMSTKRIVGKHTRKTAAFVRACAAYAFITIPSLNGVFHKLNLYLVSGQVALINECVSQAEAFFKGAISLIPSVPRYLEFDGKVRSTEPMLADFVSNFMSMLVVVPDPPDQAPLYLVRGLLNILQDYTWDVNLDTKALVFSNMLVVLSAMGQEEIPYKIARIDSNDALYGSDPKFLAELTQLTSTLFQQILTDIQSLDATDTRKRQAVLCLAVFNRVVAHADPSHPDTITVAKRLWSTAIRHNQLDSSLIGGCIQYVTARSKRNDGKPLIELLKLMSK